MGRPFLVAFTALAGSLGASCGLFCDDEVDFSCGGSAYRETPSCAKPLTMGCNASGAWGGLAVALPALEDGTYVLEGTVDGAPFSCPLTVTAGEPTAECPDWRRGWSPEPTIGLEEVPCSVTLVVRSGETVLASGEFSPDYDWDEPWGEACDWRGYARVELVRAGR